MPIRQGERTTAANASHHDPRTGSASSRAAFCWPPSCWLRRFYTRSIHMQDRRLQQPHGDQQKLIAADALARWRTCPRAEHRAQAAADEPEEALSLVVALQVSHEPPEDADHEQVEDADPYEVRGEDQGVAANRPWGQRDPSCVAHDSPISLNRT